MIDAEQYLNQIRNISIQINEKAEEIAILQAQIEGGSISFGSDGTTSGYKDNERNAHMIMRLTELKDDLNKQIDMLVLAKKEAIEMIDKLSDANHITILYERYVHYKSWEYISNKLNYSIRHIHRIHGDALKEFQKILLKDVTQCHTKQ